MMKVQQGADADWQRLKEIAKAMEEARKNQGRVPPYPLPPLPKLPHDWGYGDCPYCGRCPHCGRGGHRCY
jgi:hypothetical protein